MNNILRSLRINKCKYYLGFNKLIGRNIHIEFLKTRSLIKIKGNDTNDFLQGMITNDINHLDKINSAMYTMFLNVQGRVLFDTIIYSSKILKTEDSYILECDSTIVQPLINHLKLHKVRRKINFEPLDNSLMVCVIFDSNIEKVNEITSDLFSQSINPSLTENIVNELPKESFIIRDPRLQYLGYRVILPKEFNVNKTNFMVSDDYYKILRYRLGVGEGVNDLPRGKCLPLEANCDYLHGISFQKGCYIGQELTARTHHTGIVRKRYMPLIFNKDIDYGPNINITNEKGKPVGKMINNKGKFGIGLMRINESLEASNLNIGEIKVETFKPGWWPLEVSKLMG